MRNYLVYSRIHNGSAGFTPGPVGPGPRAGDPRGPTIMRGEKRKKERGTKKVQPIIERLSSIVVI